MKPQNPAPPTEEQVIEFIRLKSIELQRELGLPVHLETTSSLGWCISMSSDAGINVSHAFGFTIAEATDDFKKRCGTAQTQAAARRAKAAALLDEAAHLEAAQ